MELVVMALILGLVFFSEYILYSRSGLKNLKYSLSISENEVYEGDEIEIIETIENNKRLPLLWVRSEISCSRGMLFRGENLEESGEQRGLISGIFSLGGYKKIKRVWKVRCERRGVMTVENAVITTGDILGLARLASVIKINESIRVLPSARETDLGAFSGDMFIGNMQVKRFVLPDPFMISGAREYTGREPMNRIHWKATAKTGELMVFNNEFSTERRVMILMNMQRRSRNFNTTLFPAILEPQIKAAAFVLSMCEKINAESALAVNTEERLFIPAALGFDHIMKALRSLAELQNMCGERFDELCESLELSDFTDIFVITPCLESGAGEMLNGLVNAGKCCKIITTGLEEGEGLVPTGCDVIRISKERFVTT